MLPKAIAILAPFALLALAACGQPKHEFAIPVSAQRSATELKEFVRDSVLANRKPLEIEDEVKFVHVEGRDIQRLLIYLDNDEDVKNGFVGSMRCDVTGTGKEMRATVQRRRTK